jgi:hypothetical protein
MKYFHRTSVLPDAAIARAAAYFADRMSPTEEGARRRRFSSTRRELTRRHLDVPETEASEPLHADQGCSPHRREKGRLAQRLEHVDAHGGIVVVGRIEPWVNAIPVALDEPAQHTFSMIATGGGFPMLGIGQVYRGLDNSAAIVAAQVLDIVAATNAFACPSLVLTTYSDLYLGIAADHMSPGTATPPAGATERVDASPVNDGGGHLEVFDLQREATGATGTQTITLSVASTGIAVAYALKTLPPPLAPAITPDVAGAIGLVRIGV